MEQFLTAHEPVLRAALFAGLFCLFALLEALRPQRVRREARSARWPRNLLLVVLGSAAIRLLGPLVAVQTAVIAQDAGWGLFNRLAWPPLLELALAVIALDLLIYAQHVAFHRVPMLWRIHRMHHTDLDLDVTSGIRFHPLEYGLSMVIKAGAVVALGASAAAVILFEIILNGMAMFNHANLRLPASLDKVLRHVLVTPDMHIVHHSIDPGETHRNFGFNLSLWDRVFRTYKAAPEAGLRGIRLGLPDWQAPERLKLGALLWMPFRKEAGARAPRRASQP